MRNVMEDTTPKIVESINGDQPRWYAFKVFFNKVFEILNMTIRINNPNPIIPNCL